ncbi:LLM class flavin-dependent oxidoreductase [Aquihabitans sp. McL0605]|uniref:LLM class flavin-dependent oxidoreductase n=1 Tax=Aquihabitans sp. McL0605 TaxID=3415671 RepID=UPI003CF1F355
MMRFDLRAPGATPAERAAIHRAAIDMAAFADEAGGCAAIVISEHHASDDGYLPSPLAMAAAMAAVTKTTAISVAAAILPFYDPVRLAEDLITLDHISEGRVMAVLGLGYRPIEYELHGVDYATRGAVADQKLERLLDVLGDAGRATVQPRVTPAPYSNPMPLLAWGGRSKAAARRAGRNGISFFAQADGPGLQEAYETAARDHGHEPAMCMLPNADAPQIVFVDDDLDAGWDAVGPSMLTDATSYYEWNEAAGTVEGTASLSSATTVAGLREANGAHRVVTPAGAAEIVAEHGILHLHPLCGGLDPEVAWTYLRRAAAAAS